MHDALCLNLLVRRLGLRSRSVNHGQQFLQTAFVVIPTRHWIQQSSFLALVRFPNAPDDTPGTSELIPN
jgi:hypothetical protein